MSYILDALKKSQQERGETGSVFSAEILSSADGTQPAVTPTGIPPVLSWGAGLVVVAALVAAAVLLKPDAESGLDSAAESESPATATVAESGSAGRVEKQWDDRSVASVATASESKQVVKAEVPVVATPKVKGVSAASGSSADVQSVSPASSAAGSVAADDAPRIIRPKTVKVLDSEPVEAESQVAGEVAEQSSPVGPGNQDGEPGYQVDESVDQVDKVEPARPTVETRRLPPLTSMRKIPDLIFTSHVYSESDPSSRSVGINERTYYEGDLIAPGVILDQITSKGILLSVDGYPLPVNHRTGWQAIGG